MDAYLPGWRERADELVSLRAELEKEREMNAAYKRSDLVDRLSASEARCRELEDQLCRAREWMILAKTLNGTECGYHDNRRRKRGMERCGKCLYCVIDYAITVHLSALPCSHAARCADLEKEVSAQRVIDMAPPHDEIWTDEYGKDYTLRWDKGDPSVGINAHWECDELDGLVFRLSAREKVVSMAIESQGWDGNSPDDERWTEFYRLARAAAKEG